MGARRCMICLSPFRNEILSAKKQGLPIGRIFTKYAPLMGYTSKKESFEQMLGRHIREAHETSAIYVPTVGIDSAIKVSAPTIESFGQRMLYLGMRKVDSMTPDQVEFKDVIASQKLILDARKIKISEDAMMIAMSKMFGPILPGEVVEDGEVVEGNK